MSRPFPSRHAPPQPLHRINGKIRAREVRIIAADGSQAGVMDLRQALGMAQSQGLDLVEIAPNAVPPVCRVVDYGKFKYELAKKEKESKKHQHANEVKEVQLSPTIDPHDLGIKMDHAVGFLCEDMAVKISLRFRGRQMAHTEIGMAVVQKFLKDIAPWGQPSNQPKLIGRSINVMIAPLPKQKRAKNPKETGQAPSILHANDEPAQVMAIHSAAIAPAKSAAAVPEPIATDAAERPSGFGNGAFAALALPKTDPTADETSPD